jgi:transcriptional regulator with XRE-family HTH domain
MLTRNARKRRRNRAKTKQELLGERLQQIRKARGLTQEQVGEALGCYASNVSHFELGKQNPTMPKLLALTKLYNCSLGELTDVGLPYPEFVSAAHKG